MIVRRLTGSQRAHCEETQVEANRLRARADALETAARDSALAEHLASSSELHGARVSVSRGPDGLPDEFRFEPVEHPAIHEHKHDTKEEASHG